MIHFFFTYILPAMCLAAAGGLAYCIYSLIKGGIKESLAPTKAPVNTFRLSHA